MRDPPIETEQLRIRPFTTADVAKLVALFRDRAVAQYVGDGSALSEADASLWVRRSRANIDRYGYGTGAVVERASGEMVGWAGFARPEDAPEEIIYGFDRERWGRGYGHEVVAAMLALADGFLRMEEVRATVDSANAVSIRLLTKHGFVLTQRGYRGEPGTDLYVRRSSARR
ncbi:GNAT family N-acetyltransferase [Sphingosinicella terrae]|uniref:GNAT family N-acetyltransferase n=1 Tax=Sphingosinicella terrae TaxID=2172047 RepID=UPI000E0D9D63|nr:GNAT family N-acetyltransferase [Sphingosinicella terrae]